jgi:hypothetical protein
MVKPPVDPTVDPVVDPAVDPMEDPAEDGPMEEPSLDPTDLMGGGIPVHGVLAPEDTESGDGRGFAPGAVTKRGYRLPLMHQKAQTAGHDNAVPVGSVDRLMRKGGLIHWEGRLMPGEDGQDFAELLVFFGNYGVSVDGDKAGIDVKKTTASGVLWFDAIRAAGLTAVAIPAFPEAYVAFGPHPEMPADGPAAAAMVASGDLTDFGRGAGWVKNPKGTARLHDYWTKPGQPGYAKIRWGTDGDFTRARRLIGEKIGANSPGDLKYLNQIIAQWHHDALGYWPGQANMPGNPTTAEIRAKRRGGKLAGGIVSLALGHTPTLSIEEMSEEELAEPDESAFYCIAAACKKRAKYTVSSDTPHWFGSYCEDHAQEYEGKSLWADEGPDYAADALEAADAIESITTDDEGWEAVLTSSARGTRALPPASYFTFHPETGATVIEEPDANGIRRTYGYAAEWGVCHIGHEGRCVGVPSDPTGGDYADFHLGRTRVSGNGAVNTGLITYKTVHRDGRQILSETAEQAHYDNVANAWASVRLGENDRGVWFSGVVLPHITEEDIVLIEASGQVSGEWKYGSLRGLQSVNIPGFPVLRSSAAFDDDGELVSLVASSFGNLLTPDGKCEPTPAERMQALAAADAEVRMAQLKAQFGGSL